MLLRGGHCPAYYRLAPVINITYDSTVAT
jgi:hypothetical protein